MSSILETDYWSTAADESLPLSLNLHPSGTAKLWIRSNRDIPARKSLGFFDGLVASELAQNAFAAICTPEFTGLSNPKSVIPGEVVRKFILKKSSAPDILKFVSEADPAPASFLRAEEEFAKVIEDVQKYPAIAIGFHMEGLPPEIAPGEEFGFQLSVSNPGLKPLRIATPKFWAEAETNLSVKAVRTDIPLALLNNSHSPSMEIAPQNIELSEPDLQDSTIVLEPGTVIVFPIRIQLLWEPGLYAFQASFESNLVDAQGNILTRFEWVSPDSPLKISGTSH